MKFFFVVALLAVMCLQVSLLFKGYQALAHNPTSSTTGKAQLLHLAISTAKFKVYFMLFYAALLVLLLNFERSWQVLGLLTRAMALSFRQRLSDIIADGVLILTVIPVCASVYYALYKPIGYDEAWTYINFTSKGLWQSISYYPLPNNHIFHTLLTNFFVLIPVGVTFAIRIPSILVNAMSLFVLYSFTREYYNKFIARISLAVFGVLLMVVYYSYRSRGYSMQCFLFITLVYSVFKIAHQPGNKLYWVYYAVSSVLGFYTMPSFLYPFIMVNVFLVLYLRKISVVHFLFNAAIAVVTLILYYPVIVRNGIQNITNNNFVKPIARSEVFARLPVYLGKVISETTGLPLALGLLIIVAGVVILLRSYKGPARYFFPLVILMAPLLLIVHSVIPFTRTFEYFTFAFAVFAGVVIFELLKNYSTGKYVWVVLIAMQVMLLANFGRKIITEERYDVVTASEITKLSGGNRFYSNSMLFDAYITYYNLVKKNDKYDMVNAYDYKRSRAINLDTLSNNTYDFYIIDNVIDSTRARSPISENEFYRVYAR